MDLSLKEKFALLALHPDNGTNIIPTFIGHGLAGAILLELAALEKLKVVDHRIILLDHKHTGDAQLDYIMDVVKAYSKPPKVKNLIAKVQGKTSRIKKPIIEGLIKKRYLRLVEKKFLFIRYKRYPSGNQSYRKDLIEHIRRLVLRKITFDNDTTLLAGLCGATRLSYKFFKGGEERKTARKRIKEIVKENEIDQAVDATVQAVQAAVMASIVITSAAVATTSN